MEALLERFLRYVSFDTRSEPGCEAVPSTEGQWVLARALQRELMQLGFEDVEVGPHACVMATLPSNVDHSVPTIGFIAHLDTAPDASGRDVKPQIIRGYAGGDIALGTSGEILSPARFPALNRLRGQTLITTDGTTLLGSDDKAGIAAIVTAMVRLKEQDLPHGRIRIAFSPDEEVGRGAGFFDVAAFDARWAYTVDGGAVGELECENFNAASATIRITGNNVHPGTAKDVMVNALTLATRIHGMLPASETPERTEGYQGFFHLVSLQGSVSQADMQYIIRDFEREGFAARKVQLADVVDAVGQGLPADCHIELVIKDSYYNMREQVAAVPHVVAIAKEAMESLDIEPLQCPIRGGTDGSQLSFKGLPCPNLFTGGYNFHGKHEFVTLEGMDKAASVVMRIATMTADAAREGRIA